MKFIIAIVVGVAFLASGTWLTSPEHARAFGVSDHSWIKDVCVGLVLVAVGVSGTRKRKESASSSAPPNIGRRDLDSPMSKLENTYNPFSHGDPEAVAKQVQKILAEAPAFGSPENLAMMEKAHREGLRFAREFVKNVESK